ncbi:complex I NDUFA9 subunit family protein [Alsobacter sp. SYSU M60028]|uniref:Complex I NDUFA9 subunit family protein n=1 Tax=Alsobacter ponti TaxID=2962936 RepID=A0ABT1LBQ9_9HYPH|nr:complex I NDUFA9 subunit family protein [Alsobacter ponti]MCP8938874.1 complex I NDUFA9 subunit family protein [Alsobacter ponti]
MDVASNQLVTVFGGSGFIGRHLVRALANKGYRIRVAVRRPDLALFLQPIGNVGQIHPVQANLRYPDSVARAIEGADAVVNLTGILVESGKQSFEAVQEKGALAVAQAVARAGITRFVQMSAIGADADSPSAYARSKAAGEAAALSEVPTAVVARPSVVFGPEDAFFNRFATLARFSPVLPMVGDGSTRFQPVFVGDVAQAITRAVQGRATPGATYELGGPEVKTFREVLEFVLAVTERRRLIVPLPLGVARVQAAVLETLNAISFGVMPQALLLTRDQVTLLQRDNVVSDEAVAQGRTLAGLGIQAETIEAVVPSYLEHYRRMGQYDTGKYA